MKTRPFLPLPSPAPDDDKGGGANDWNTLRATLAGGNQERADALQAFDSPDKLFERITAKPPEFDWRKAMAGEDPEEIKALERFSDLPTVRKSWREAEKMARESGRVRVPGEGATPEQVAEWGKAIGVAEKADAYDIKVQPPAGYQVSDSDKAILSRAQERVHEVLAKGGKAPDVMNAIHEFYFNEAANAANDSENRAADMAIESEQELKGLWGGQFDENVKWAVAGAKQFFTPSAPDKLDDEFDAFLGQQLPSGHKLGDHPTFLRMFANIGRQFAEDPFFSAVRDKNPGFDPVKRKDEIMEMRNKNPRLYASKEIQEELDRINAGLERRKEQGRAA